MVNNFDSGCVELLETLKEFTLNSTADLIMPVRQQKGDAAPPAPRAANVYLMWLPDPKIADKKAPYILHQLITAKDQQPHGQRPRRYATVRSIFTVYSEDGQEGGLLLLNLVERLRIDLLKKVVIGNRFKLNLDAELEFMIYPEDIAPYYAGEMVTNWEIPTIEREVKIA